MYSFSQANLNMIIWLMVVYFYLVLFFSLHHNLQEPDKPYNILICGLPNTGKSSLINALRRKYMRKGNYDGIDNSGHLTGCVGTNPHNLPTSSSSA